MPVIDNHPDSLPKNLTLDEYVLAVENIDISETSQERVTSLLQGLLLHSYEDLAIGQDDRAAGFQLLRLDLAQDSGFAAAVLPVGVGLPSRGWRK